MARRIYRLMSGKIAHKNAEGKNEIHKAPYDFIPTDSEFQANRFRLRPVGWERTENPSPIQVAKEKLLETAAALFEEHFSSLAEPEQTMRRARFHEAVMYALEGDLERLPPTEPAAERKITVDEIPAEIPVAVPVDTRKSIAELSQSQALSYIGAVGDETELNRLLEEETQGRSRIKIVSAIEKRRDDLRTIESEMTQADNR